MASVNKPVDVKQKDADIARKLQVYGIISAFQAGKIPSNDQIDIALNSFLQTKALSKPSDKLSPEGQALVADFRDVVKKAQHLVLSKNEGNLLQDFIWQTTHFDPKSVQSPQAPVDKDTARAHGNRAAEGLRTLGTLIITNGQFRKLLKDASILLRDMAGDAATKAASNVKPSQDDLSQIDRPADDNVWHDAPNLSKDNIRKQVQGVYKNNKANGQTPATTEPGQIAPGQTSPLQSSAVQPTTAGVNGQEPPPEVQLTAEAQQAAKQKGVEYRARTKRYLEQKVPKDRREATVWRLKKMLIECQQHPEYQAAIHTLLDLASEYGYHAKALGMDSSDAARDARASNLGQAERDLKTLIERFANGTSTDDLWNAIGQIYRDADQDPELRNWLKRCNRYIRRCLEEQGYVIDESSTEEWDQLYDEGSYLLRDKYKLHVDRILDEVKFLFSEFDKDPLNRSFREAIMKLFTDLGNDENGKPVFKKHLVKDLTEVIIPATLENIAYVPIPRIEYQDPQIDFVVENLVLESDNFTPNVMEIDSSNYMRWGRKTVKSSRKHSGEIKVAGVQMDLRDVSYYVKRKKGFPSLTDVGLMDIFMGGNGFSFKLKLSTPDKKDAQNFFKVDKVDVEVSNLSIKIHQSNHKFLFSIAKPIMLKVMRPAIEKALGKVIKDRFNEFDQILFQLKQEADKALEEAQSDPENVPNIYSRYASAVQRRALATKKKTEEAVADKKVNYAVTTEDSIFPDIKLPGPANGSALSTRAAEFKELATKGSAWESPVFSVGEASKSTDVPAAPQITRKVHNTGNGNGVGAGPGMVGSGPDMVGSGPGMVGGQPQITNGGMALHA
ncbi:uncharacterized protein PgNI_09469 [Pyricularia grisea]|uniref:Uncharacterized protein n=1 Tax=Pyricularia grisea TaxID=148305 RepID=A0A6P8AT80_PYRGI|nr:uncharacterized protein PgNI_09469 [Pyricularia grisea]TLD05336.1 hypothetical protein PgNI_09469 [Pyricularia grisea]